MKKIESLTPEQIAKFPEYVRKWTDIGLSTKPADRPMAEKAIKAMYSQAGMQEPKIVWCSSPFSKGIARALLINAKLWDSVRDSVWDSGYGQHDANWIGFYDFFRNETKLVIETEKLSALTLLTQSAGWFIPHEHICFVSERHNILNRDNRGRLHSIDAPACAYPDGYAIYAVHGVRVPEYVVMRPNEITVEKIESETNAEVRRVMVERYGQYRYLLDSKATQIHSDDFGTLYRKEIPNDEPLVMVKVVNSTPEPDGSFKDYFIRVPPQIKRAREAVAWTFGKKEMEYAPCVQT